MTDADFFGDDTPSARNIAFVHALVQAAFASHESRVDGWANFIWLAPGDACTAGSDGALPSDLSHRSVNLMAPCVFDSAKKLGPAQLGVATVGDAMAFTFFHAEFVQLICTWHCARHVYYPISHLRRIVDDMNVDFRFERGAEHLCRILGSDESRVFVRRIRRDMQQCLSSEMDSDKCLYCKVVPNPANSGCNNGCNSRKVSTLEDLHSGMCGMTSRLYPSPTRAFDSIDVDKFVILKPPEGSDGKVLVSIDGIDGLALPIRVNSYDTYCLLRASEMASRVKKQATCCFEDAIPEADIVVLHCATLACKAIDDGNVRKCDECPEAYERVQLGRKYWKLVVEAPKCGKQNIRALFGASRNITQDCLLLGLSTLFALSDANACLWHEPPSEILRTDSPALNLDCAAFNEATIISRLIMQYWEIEIDPANIIGKNAIEIFEHIETAEVSVENIASVIVRVCGAHHYVADHVQQAAAYILSADPIEVGCSGSKKKRKSKIDPKLDAYRKRISQICKDVDALGPGTASGIMRIDKCRCESCALHKEKSVALSPTDLAVCHFCHCRGLCNDCMDLNRGVCPECATAWRDVEFNIMTTGEAQKQASLEDELKKMRLEAEASDVCRELMRDAESDKKTHAAKKRNLETSKQLEEQRRHAAAHLELLEQTKAELEWAKVESKNLSGSLDLLQSENTSLVLQNAALRKCIDETSLKYQALERTHAVACTIMSREIKKGEDVRLTAAADANVALDLLCGELRQVETSCTMAKYETPCLEIHEKLSRIEKRQLGEIASLRDELKGMDALRQYLAASQARKHQVADFVNLVSELKDAIKQLSPAGGPETKAAAEGALFD